MKSARLFMNKTVPYLLIAPSFIILFLLMLYPVIWNIQISLHDVSLITLSGKWNFKGFGNYLDLLKDTYFLQSLFITLKFVAGSVIFQMVVGFTLALLLNNKVRGIEGFRVFFIVPWLLSDVIVGFTWQWLYHSKFGILNQLLSYVNLPGVDWLGVPQNAIWSIVATNVWFGAPFTMLFLGAALKTIPSELYEAATVDGATVLQRFWNITIAYLMRFISTNLILLTMWTVNLFGLQYVMSGGGPLFSTTTLSLYMYKTAFEFGDIAKGSSMGFVLLLVNLTAAVLYVKLAREE